MHLPSILKSTTFVAAATVLGATAAFAGPFGSGGVTTTSETSYESLVLNNGDVLNGIFNVSQITNANGPQYVYGAGGTYLVGAFTGFTLAGSTGIAGGTRLYFTGGALNYYTFGSDPFAGGALTSGTPANQGADIAAIQSGALQLSLVPELIQNPTSCPVAGCTLYIDVFGGLNNFAAASTSTVYLDITGGASAGLFERDSILNTFTAVLADAAYQGSANSQQCAAFPAWQVCGTNHATFSVIPEPITVSLFGAGLAGVAAIRRRKVKKA
jgi:hypothetical protein